MNTNNASVKAVKSRAAMTNSDLSEVVADLFHINFIVVSDPAATNEPPLWLRVL